MQIVVFCLLTLPLVSSQQMYWNTIPTHGNEVLLIAGANLSTITTVKLCRDASCQQVLSTLPADAWNESVKAILPATLVPPVVVVLCSDDGCMTPFPLNTPDVWWVYDGTQPTGRMGITGGLLRIYGRGLGWDNRFHCLPSSARQTANGTTLQLGAHTLVGLNATCYEASFDLTGVAAGTYTQALLTTPWGRNTTTIVVAAAPTPNTTIIDVDQVRLVEVVTCVGLPERTLAATVPPKPCALGLRRGLGKSRRGGCKNRRLCPAAARSA